MKTLEQVIKEYKSETIDGRDLSRLAAFVPTNRLHEIDMKVDEDDVHEPLEFTRENILIQLQVDNDFGFEKALNKRGLSASAMYNVVQMWHWVLEEGLESFDDYTQYGLPLFKATALKYGFKNRIGSDNGNEYKYSAEAEDE